MKIKKTNWHLLFWYKIHSPIMEVGKVTYPISVGQTWICSILLSFLKMLSKIKL